MTECVYKGEKDECLFTRDKPCAPCPDQLRLQDSQFVNRYRDPLFITNREDRWARSLCGMLADKAVFLACGGPSANDLPLEALNRRGMWTMAVNNMAGHPRFRPQAFVCADPLTKFSHSIWLDPGIMKFVPLPKMNGYRAKLRRKDQDGFHSLDQTVRACPNVWAYKRDTWFLPDDSFLMGEGAKWGNLSAGVTRTGLPKTVATMLLALRLLYHLGAKRIFLVGVDFQMTVEKGYAFDQERNPGAVASNNGQYAIVSRWLEDVVANGVFERFGLEVYNTNERSGLRAFSYVPFETALQDVQGFVDDEPDLIGWYEPRKKK